jgi:hypothetical protein
VRLSRREMQFPQGAAVLLRLAGHNVTRLSRVRCATPRPNWPIFLGSRLRRTIRNVQLWRLEGAVPGRRMPYGRFPAGECVRRIRR